MVTLISSSLLVVTTFGWIIFDHRGSSLAELEKLRTVMSIDVESRRRRPAARPAAHAEARVFGLFSCGLAACRDAGAPSGVGGFEVFRLIHRCPEPVS